jgi:hypothetical protein
MTAVTIIWGYMRDVCEGFGSVVAQGVEHCDRCLPMHASTPCLRTCAVQQFSMRDSASGAYNAV